MTRHVIQNLAELKDLLKELPQEQYIKRLEIISNATISQHVRHILEFYKCLFESGKSGTVNYDGRQRDINLENNIHMAISLTDEIINMLAGAKADFPVNFKADYSTDDHGKPAYIKSTFFREIAYNLEHSVHHQALIKVAITEMKLTALVKDTFGFAPSTIRHQKKCVQ